MQRNEASSGSHPRVAILIPCYNEALTISHVVRDFHSLLPHARIYVYDNNSTDDTLRVAAEAGAIVRKEPQQGKGHVVRRMFRDVEADFYVLVDGDDTYESRKILHMLDLAYYGMYDLVNGVRVDVRAGDEYRRGHRFGNQMLTSTVRFLFGDRIEDMLSGYKVLSRRFVKSFPVLSSGFEIETEMAVHALELGMPIAHVKCTYRSRPEGLISKLNTLADGRRILFAIINLFKQERPLLFLGFVAALFAAMSLAIGIPVTIEYLQTGVVLEFPRAFLALGLMVISFLTLACGVILDTVSRGRLEAKLLRYLSIPPIINAAAELDGTMPKISAIDTSESFGGSSAQPQLRRSGAVEFSPIAPGNASYAPSAIVDMERVHVQGPSVAPPRKEETRPLTNKSLRKPLERTVGFHVTFAILSFILFAVITNQLGKDVGFDLLNYHFYNGYSLFTGAWARNVVPAQLQTFLNPEPDLLTYLLIYYLPPAGAGILMGGLQGLNFWLIFVIASFLIRFRDHGLLYWLQWPIWLGCAALGMYSPAAVSELGVFMQDLFTALFVVGGVALAIAALSVQMRTAKSTALLSVGFLLIGFAVGLKLTNLPFAAGAAIAFIPSLNVRQWRSVAVSYVALGCGFLLGGGYWMWNMWVRYRNPFFLFNGVFKSPYAVPTDVNLDGRFLPTSLQKWILYPFYFHLNTTAFPLELPFQDYSIAVCYVLLVIAGGVGIFRVVQRIRNAQHGAGYPKSSHLTWLDTRVGNPTPHVAGNASPTSVDALQFIPGRLLLRLVGFALVSYILWETLSANYRYLTPLVLLAPVIIASVIVWLIRRPFVATSLVLLVLVAIAEPTSTIAGGDQTPGVPHTLGWSLPTSLITR